MGTFKSIGGQYLKDTWGVVAREIYALGCGGFFTTEKMRHSMPKDLLDSSTLDSWVCGGWTSPCGGHPLSTEAEKSIVQSMIQDLNGLFNLGLGTDPCLDRLESSGEVTPPKKILVIGGSHAIREGKVLADRGFEVVLCAVSGWRPNKSAIEDMEAKVADAVQQLGKDDIVLIHCFDNVAFMARSDEGGDLPIRKFISGDYNIEGDLVVAGKDRLYIYFRNCLPIFKLLEAFSVYFLSPMARYLYSSCCTRADHAPNRLEDGFEPEFRKSLAECRNNYKTFFFHCGFQECFCLEPGSMRSKGRRGGHATVDH